MRNDTRVTQEQITTENCLLHQLEMVESKFYSHSFESIWNARALLLGTPMDAFSFTETGANLFTSNCDVTIVELDYVIVTLTLTDNLQVQFVGFVQLDNMNDIHVHNMTCAKSFFGKPAMTNADENITTECNDFN